MIQNIIQNISKYYERIIVVSSHNFNKILYNTNKQHSVTNLQLLHSYSQLSLQVYPPSPGKINTHNPLYIIKRRDNCSGYGLNSIFTSSNISISTPFLS